MFFRTIAAVGLAIALNAFSMPAGSATIFSASLSGDQEVNPSGSTGTGQASFEVQDNGILGLSLVFDMSFDPIFNFGLVGSTGTQIVSGLHIHMAPRGVNGGIVFGLLQPNDNDDGDIVFSLLADGSTRITGEWDAMEGRPTGPTFADLAADFLGTGAGEDAPFYLNLHTTEFPAGEIRGQIVADPAPVPLPATLPLLAAGVLLLGLREGARHRSRRHRRVGAE